MTVLLVGIALVDTNLIYPNRPRSPSFSMSKAQERENLVQSSCNEEILMINDYPNIALTLAPRVRQRIVFFRRM
jgi:hypothetical protein